jgi:hypothetical protein
MRSHPHKLSPELAAQDFAVTGFWMCLESGLATELQNAGEHNQSCKFCDSRRVKWCGPVKESKPTTVKPQFARLPLSAEEPKVKAPTTRSLLALALSGFWYCHRDGRIVDAQTTPNGEICAVCQKRDQLEWMKPVEIGEAAKERAKDYVEQRTS